MQGIGYGRPKPVESGRLSPQWCRLDFLPAASGCEFLGRAIGPAQEPWDELVHARGRPQIDEPSQDVDEICLRIDTGQLAVPTSSTMWDQNHRNWDMNPSQSNLRYEMSDRLASAPDVCNC